MGMELVVPTFILSYETKSMKLRKQMSDTNASFSLNLDVSPFICMINSVFKTKK